LIDTVSNTNIARNTIENCFASTDCWTLTFQNRKKGVQMPVEIQILGYAALLQFAQFLLMAVPVNLQLGPGYILNNRDEQQQPTGIPGRLMRAYDNHYEGLILFAIVVVVVVLGDAGSAQTESYAWTYLAARVLYVPAYASGIFMVRSLIWFVGFVATLLMLTTALFP
jgi:uncharacterized MAPEG superfamily protein